MKVKELVALLNSMDPELEVITDNARSKGYGKVLFAVVGIFDGEGEWDRDWSASEAMMDDDEWEQFKEDNKDVVCLGVG